MPACKCCGFHCNQSGRFFPFRCHGGNHKKQSSKKKKKVLPPSPICRRVSKVSRMQKAAAHVSFLKHVTAVIRLDMASKVARMYQLPGPLESEAELRCTTHLLYISHSWFMITSAGGPTFFSLFSSFEVSVNYTQDLHFIMRLDTGNQELFLSSHLHVSFTDLDWRGWLSWCTFQVGDL